MNNQDIIEGVIDNEDASKQGKVTVDEGGRTQYGISERSNPEAWADGRVTEEEARRIYEHKYLKGPGFDKVEDRRLRFQLVDFGVNSGPGVAIRELQQILGVKADGHLGPKTLEALSTRSVQEVNNQLLCARIRMFGRIVTQNPRHIKDISGWLNRATEFLL